MAQVASSAVDGDAQMPHPRRESNSRVVMAEKVLRELRNRNFNRTVAPSSRARTDVPENPGAEDPVPPSIQAAERCESLCYEVDGGVRLAGGRVGEVLADDLDGHDTVNGLTLPPPYSSHYGAA